MRHMLWVLVFSVVVLCRFVPAVHGADDESFRNTFYRVVESLSEPYYYGEEPQVYDIPLNPPPMSEQQDGACPESLQGFVRTAQQLAVDQQVADRIRAEGLSAAMHYEAVRAHRQARKAAENLARLQAMQGQWAGPNWQDDAFAAGRRAFEETQIASERNYREARGLPQLEGDGMLGDLLGGLAIAAARQYAAQAVANTESQVSQDTAADIERSAENRRSLALSSLFTKFGEQLEKTSGAPVYQLPIDWLVHYEPTSGTLCLQAVNQADHTLEKVIIRLHSKLSGIPSKTTWSSFTLAVASWEPEKSVVVSNVPLMRLHLTKSGHRDAAKWSGHKFKPGDLVATVYTSGGYYMAHDLMLPLRSSAVGYLETGDERTSVILRLKAQPFASERKWVSHGEIKVLSAKAVKSERGQVTLADLEHGRTEVVPLRILSAEDRKYVRSQAGQLASTLARSWTLRPEISVVATFRSMADTNTARLQTAAGEEILVPLSELLPPDRLYLATLAALR